MTIVMLVLNMAMISYLWNESDRLAIFCKLMSLSSTLLIFLHNIRITHDFSF